MVESPRVPVKDTFEARAEAQGYVCTMCGKAISYEDEEAYLESQRCCRCHYELDTDSGPIPAL
jgi:transcription initiation factor IIE alpha subunit